MGSRWIGIGACVCGIGVLLGAFATHALRESLETRMLEVFETGVRYQIFHGLALIGLGAVWEKLRCPHRAAWTGGLLLAGVVIFSGSLYVLALTGERRLGMLAPVGGATLIAAWGVFALNAFLAAGAKGSTQNG